MPVGRIFKHSTQPLLQTLVERQPGRGGSKTIIASPYRYTDSSAGLRKTENPQPTPCNSLFARRQLGGKGKPRS